MEIYYITMQNIISSRAFKLAKFLVYNMALFLFLQVHQSKFASCGLFPWFTGLPWYGLALITLGVYGLFYIALLVMPFIKSFLMVDYFRLKQFNRRSLSPKAAYQAIKYELFIRYRLCVYGKYNLDDPIDSMV